jgi:hypothetical protein
MKSLVRASIVLLLGIASGAVCAQQSPVGVWRLISWVHAPQAGGEKVEPWGPSPLGFISYTPGGRMSAVVTAPNRKASNANTQQLPVDEQARFFRSAFSYAGRYRLEADGVVVHRVEVASDPNWAGTEQRRFFKIDGNKLTITTPPVRILNEANARVHTLVWERVE